MRRELLELYFAGIDSHENLRKYGLYSTVVSKGD